MAGIEGRQRCLRRGVLRSGCRNVGHVIDQRPCGVVEGDRRNGRCCGRDLRQRWRFGGLQRLRHDRLQRRQRLFQRNRFVQLRRRRVQAVSGDLVGPARCLVQVRLQRSSCGAGGGAGWPGASCRLGSSSAPAATPADGHAASRPDDGPSAGPPSHHDVRPVRPRRRPGSGPVRTTPFPGAQCVLNGRLQRNHHDLRSGVVQQLRLKAVRVVFQHQLHIRMRQCLAQALARRAGTASRATAGAAWVSLTDTGDPQQVVRYASGPVPGTACPDNAGHRSRRRAGGACHRCAK